MAGTSPAITQSFLSNQTYVLIVPLIQAAR
jgi:hypothetical protein